MEHLWAEVQDSLRRKIGSQGYEIWIRPITVSSMDPERIRLLVPNRYYRDWVQNNYGATLCEELGAVLGHPVTVEFDIGSPGPTPDDRPREAVPPTAAPINGQPVATPQAAASQPEAPVVDVEPSPATTSTTTYPPFASRKTFQTFVVGACNQFAHACAEAVAEAPDESGYNPLFIYGGTGLGKTHLLHSIANRIQELDPEACILYTTAENFTNKLIESLRYGRMEEFRDDFRNQPTFLLMDDVQFVGGKDRTQEELFHTFEELKKRGVQIVFAADVLPREIKGFEPRLRTRCESGMLADMQAPDLETLAAILHQKAEELGLILPPDLAQYIGSRVGGSIRELEGVLNRLSAACRLYHSSPTIEFAREHLSEVLVDEVRKPTAEEIIQTVASFYNLKVSDLKGTRRLKQIVQPRHVAMWLVRKHCELSFPEIGRVFGRDHATVQHACKKIRNQISRDADLRTAIEALTRSLGL